MAIMTFKRFEEKFIVTENQYEKIIKEIEEYMLPDKYCLNGEEYSIYNVYFDTSTDELIRHSISQTKYKEKIRMRSYYPQNSVSDKVFLEIKRKVNGIVYKRRVLLTIEQVFDFIKNKNIFDTDDTYISKQVINEISYFLRQYSVLPKVSIRYDRCAFYGKDDKSLRLTFDRNIYGRRENLVLGADVYDKRILSEGYRIMEIKNNGAIPLWFVSILSKYKIYNTSFSKYGTEYKMFVKDKISSKRKVV